MTKKRHPLRDLPIRWSFGLYAAICILVALGLSIALALQFNRLQMNIDRRYEDRYADELIRRGDIVVDGEVVEKDAIQFYTRNIRSLYTKRDAFLYDLCGALSMAVGPVVFLACVSITGFVFYRRKLKEPLAVLDAASARIAGGDLDFHVTYSSQNELGHLAASFENMRSSLLETHREMWQMTQARRRLNAAFAHDLRTPLTVLRGYCEFLLAYLPGGRIGVEKTLSTLTLMDAHVRRLEAYTASMSTLQRLEEILPQAVPTAFPGLCDALASAAETLLGGEKALTVVRDGEGAPCVDAGLIHRVCDNLVANAKRYAAREIRMAFGYHGGFFILSVWDDGPGFSREALQRAAEPYFREEAGAGDSEHMGVGLYTCELLCQRHGGALEIKNEGGGKVTARFSDMAAPCR